MDVKVSNMHHQLESLFAEKGSLKEALSAFQTAYKVAVQESNEETERACSFNLGAVYIALKEPVKGLDYLYQVSETIF